MHNLRIIHEQHRNIKYKCVSHNNPREIRFFSNRTQVKPCRAGKGTGWVTLRKYRRDRRTLLSSFFSSSAFLPIEWCYF